MPVPYVIGIDSSTTSCKAIAWDLAGQALAEGRCATPMSEPHPGWHEQDAEDWWNGACAALRGLLAQVNAAQAAALCITHQRESFVPVDRSGRPLRPAILWLDERSRAEVGQLEAQFGRERLHTLTGKIPCMSPALPKILWLRRYEPEILSGAYKLLDTHAFLVSRLTGEYLTSLASADPLGLVDMCAGVWALELVDGAGLHIGQLPGIVPPGALIGRVTAAAATVTGLPAGLPVIAGGGDGQFAGLGANALRPGRAYLNLGTAVAGGVSSPTYRTDPAFRTLCAPVPGSYCLEMLLRGGLYTVAWFVERFASDLRAGPGPRPEEVLESQAATLPPGAGGLVAVPYWNGVMNPYWDAAATGITVGWTGAHTRAHFYRAILEGIAFEQRLAGDAVMAVLGQPFDEYIALGGGSRSSLWCQIIADVTGVPVARSSAVEATCLGAGILAAAAIGWYPSVAAAANSMTSTAQRFTPDPAARATYDQLYDEVYRRLFPTLQSLLDRLASLSATGEAAPNKASSAMPSHVSRSDAQATCH